MIPDFCLFPFLHTVGLGIELGALRFATELCHQPNFFLFVYSSFLVYLCISQVNQFGLEITVAPGDL